MSLPGPSTTTISMHQHATITPPPILAMADDKWGLRHIICMSFILFISSNMIFLQVDNQVMTKGCHY